MATQKISAGAQFPEISVNTLNHGERSIGRPEDNMEWQMVVVYRGKHCPLCTRYLNELEKHREQLHELGIGVIAVSGDSKEQAAEHNSSLDIDYPIGYNLSIEQMKSLGLYISYPRSSKETDHPFSEPGLFVVNAEGKIQLVDISNGPFARPELSTLVSGMAFIRNPENNYPIRGTYE